LTELKKADEATNAALNRPSHFRGRRATQRRAKRTLTPEQQYQVRLDKAKAIVATGKIEQISDTQWHVPSQMDDVIRYVVGKSRDSWTCDCDDFARRGEECKHCLAVRLFIGDLNTAEDGC
jgi:hypothetical protein